MPSLLMPTLPISREVTAMRDDRLCDGGRPGYDAGDSGEARYREPGRMNFREWLFLQDQRKDYIGDLARSLRGTDVSWLLRANDWGTAGYALYERDAHPMEQRAFDEAYLAWRELMRKQRNKLSIPWRPIKEDLEFYRGEMIPYYKVEEIRALERKYGSRWDEQVVRWEPQDRPGYVYCMRAENGACKIGRTIDLSARFKAVDLVTPFELEMIGYIETDDCHELERQHHMHYAEYWLKGEWFQIPDDRLLHYRDKFHVWLYQPELSDELIVIAE